VLATSEKDRRSRGDDLYDIPDTPIDTLGKAKPADLERIAEMVGRTGFSIQISA